MILLALAQLAAATAQGALKLDNYTFDKVLAIPGKSFFVKFDQSYAYGEKEDAFKALCKLSYDVPNFLMGEIPVQEYGDKDNEDLAKRFKLKKEDWPAYFLFNGAHKEGLRYTDKIEADAIAAWLRRQQIGMPSVGTIFELDQIAKRFLNSGLDAKEIEAAEKLAKDKFSNDRKAPLYVKIMEKIKEKGAGYVESESKRVSKLLEGKLPPEKSTEMNSKLKILGVFASKEEL